MKSTCYGHLCCDFLSLLGIATGVCRQAKKRDSIVWTYVGLQQNTHAGGAHNSIKVVILPPSPTPRTYPYSSV